MKKWIALLIIAAVGVGGWAWLQTHRTPIRIGYLSTLSGKYSSHGASARNGAMLAVKELNEAGGVDGREVQLVVRDDKARSEFALVLMEEFASSDVVAVIGPLLSYLAIEVVPVANSHELPVIGPLISTHKLAAKDDFFVMMYPSTRDYGRAMGDLVRVHNWRNLVVVGDAVNEEYVKSFSGSFLDRLEEMGRNRNEVAVLTKTLNQKVGDLAAEVARLQPDFVLLLLSPMDGAMFCQFLRKLGSKARLAGASWTVSRDFIVGGGRAVDGFQFYAPYDMASSSDRFVKFKQAYISAYRLPPTFSSMFYYDAVKLVAKTYARSGGQGGKEFLKALVSMPPYNGVQQVFMFDKNATAHHELKLMQVQNGRVRMVEGEL